MAFFAASVQVQRKLALPAIAASCARACAGLQVARCKLQAASSRLPLTQSSGTSLASLAKLACPLQWLQAVQRGARARLLFRFQPCYHSLQRELPVARVHVMCKACRSCISRFPFVLPLPPQCLNEMQTMRTTMKQPLQPLQQPLQPRPRQPLQQPLQQPLH